eukprot:scaffold17829_cov30-Tisochrysis_lutea.AAC.5
MRAPSPHPTRKTKRHYILLSAFESVGHSSLSSATRQTQSGPVLGATSVSEPVFLRSDIGGVKRNGALPAPSTPTVSSWGASVIGMASRFTLPLPCRGGRAAYAMLRKGAVRVRERIADAASLLEKANPVVRRWRCLALASCSALLGKVEDAIGTLAAITPSRCRCRAARFCASTARMTVLTSDGS